MMDAYLWQRGVVFSYSRILTEYYGGEAFALGS